MKLRVGHGYDIHRLVEGRPLFLGGVKIDHSKGLLGHSDADVALHALCDSLLGAAGLPDIGYFFPPSDSKFKDISSLELLREVHRRISEPGWQISNVDISIVAEAPKISPHLVEMKKAIAQVLGIDSSQIGIKATTNEGVDQIGEGEAICAHAVCLLSESGS